MNAQIMASASLCQSINTLLFLWIYFFYFVILSLNNLCFCHGQFQARFCHRIKSWFNNFFISACCAICIYFACEKHYNYKLRSKQRSVATRPHLLLRRFSFDDCSHRDYIAVSHISLQQFKIFHNSMAARCRFRTLALVINLYGSFYSDTGAL